MRYSASLIARSCKTLDGIGVIRVTIETLMSSQGWCARKVNDSVERARSLVPLPTPERSWLSPIGSLTSCEFLDSRIPKHSAATEIFVCYYVIPIDPRHWNATLTATFFSAKYLMKALQNHNFDATILRFRANLAHKYSFFYNREGFFTRILFISE